MRSSLKWLERLTANAEVATVPGSIPAASDTVESKGRQMKQCWIQYIEIIILQKVTNSIVICLQDYTIPLNHHLILNRNPNLLDQKIKK